MVPESKSKGVPKLCHSILDVAPYTAPKRTVQNFAISWGMGRRINGLVMCLFVKLKSRWKGRCMGRPRYDLVSITGVVYCL